jgi:hypothetical protein
MDGHETTIRHEDEATSLLAPKRRYDRFEFRVGMSGRCYQRHLE